MDDVGTTKARPGKRLLAATLLLVVLVCSAMLFVQSTIEKQYRATISNTLSTILDDVTANVLLWHRERRDDARIWAGHPDLIAYAKALLALRNNRDSLIKSPSQEKLRKLLKPVLEARGYQGFFIISPESVNLASTRDANIGTKTLLSSQSYFIETLLLGNTAVSLPQLSDVPLPDETGKLVKERPTMFVGAPILNTDGDVLALLSFRIDPNRVFNKIIERGRVGDTGETYAFNRDGLLLTHIRFESQLWDVGVIKPDQDSVLRVYIRDPGGNYLQGFRSNIDPTLLPLTVMADSAISGESAMNIEGYRDYRGVKVVGAWRWLGRLGFGLTAEQEFNEAYDAILNFRYQTAVSTLFIVLLVSGLAFIVHFSSKRTAENARRFRAVFDNVVDGLIIIDEKGTVESMNLAAEGIFGYEINEVRGKNIKMLMPPHYANEYDGYLSNFLQTGDSEIIGQQREVEGKRKSGEVFPIELGISIVKLHDRILFLGLLRDVTERKKSERELRESEDSLANAQRIAKLGSWRRSLKVERQIWSDEMYRILGYEPQEFEASYPTYLSCVHPDDVRAMKKAVEKSQEDGSTYNIEHRIVQPDGTVRHVLEQGGCTFDDEGNPDYISGIIQDITERKKVDRMKSEFVSTVSHELRTPLTSIHGSLGLLIGGAAGEFTDQAKSLLGIAHKSSDRLIRLINDILDSEKLEANRMSFNMKPHNIVDLVEKSLIANKAYGEQFEVTFVVKSKVNKAEVMADDDRFDQIMANLLSNAAKFSPKGGKVEVLIERIDDNVVVSVRDKGHGIPEEFMDTIFQKFAQADSSDTRKVSGTGLGLSIFKKLVERMGGEVGFESSEGEGTTFHFSLPELGEKKPEILMAESFDSTFRVLICEDDPDVAHLLRLMLSQNALDCDIAYSAEEATQMLSQRPYSAMTLDLMLPDKDGITLLRELRASEATKDLPVIIVSARAGEGKEELNGDAFGVIDWLTKPLDPEKLKSAISQITGAEISGRPLILHVEDDLDIVEVISVMLRDVADVVGAGSLKEAKVKLDSDEYSLVILDVELPDGSGLELLSQLDVPVLVFSAGDIPPDISKRVNAALVKSMTSNTKLTETIKTLITHHSTK